MKTQTEVEAYNENAILDSNNRLISEFMGLTKSDRLYKNHFTYVGEDIIKAGLPFKMGFMGNCMDILPFNSSWDWLMPVVEKIESKGFDTFINTCNCVINDCGQGIMDDIDYQDRAGNKLNATYNAVVDFIKWYNQNKQ